MAEILDDPQMEAVEKIVREGVDPADFDKYVEIASRYILDLDANAAGPQFLVDPLGVIVVEPEFTYLVGVGMRRSVDGIIDGAGIFRQRTRPSTVDVVDAAVFPLEQCGSELPRIVRSGDDPPAPAIDIVCGPVRLVVDISADPPDVRTGS